MYSKIRGRGVTQLGGFCCRILSPIFAIVLYDMIRILFVFDVLMLCFLMFD